MTDKCAKAYNSAYSALNRLYHLTPKEVRILESQIDYLLSSGELQEHDVQNFKYHKTRILDYLNINKTRLEMEIARQNAIIEIAQRRIRDLQGQLYG